MLLTLGCAVIAAASAVHVPLPYLTCAYTRSGLVLAESLHAEYVQAADRARAILRDGVETTTTEPATAAHFIPAHELREASVWRWQDAGDVPRCPPPLARRPPVVRDGE